MKKILSRLAIAALVLLVFSCVAFATEGETAEYLTEGYVYNREGKETNIKWTITNEDGENVCRFEIDSAATGKVQTTVVTACDASGTSAGWSTNKIVPWYYGGKVNKMVFGPGITGAEGGVYMVISTIRTIEISPDFKTTGFATFESNAGLNTFYVTGKEPKKGHGDFSTMSKIGSYCFDGAKFESIDLSGSITGISDETFKANKLREVVFPENIKAVGEKAFISNASLKKVTFENASCKIAESAFNGCVQLFTFVGYKGSTAEAFAKNGGYKFVDILTNETVFEGTRKIEKDPAEIIESYPREEADDSGLLVAEYQGSKVVNTYWAYFKDSKTIVFYNNSTGYNETGNGNSTTETSTKFTDYKDEAEHVIISSGIHKITTRAFEDFTALKTVGVGVNTAQIDHRAFHNCVSLRSVYKLGQDPVDGVADLTMITRYPNSILKNTAIETVKLNINTKVSDINSVAFIGCKNLLAAVSDEMKSFAKSNFINLINVNDENEKYEYYQYINPDTAAAGTSSIASFDEATGTLTILGSGEMNDIVNYYGGGSKNQPWFKYKNDIKKVVIGPEITYIGKYSFCQCVNLSEVVLSGNDIIIAASAFEKCYGLKSVYKNGNEAVLGTFDLSSVTELAPWTFAYNYYAVNPIFSEKATEIKKTSFDGCINIMSVYGVPGTYAEEYSKEYGYTFTDISLGIPEAVLATPPEMNQDEQEQAERGDEVTEEIPETEAVLFHLNIVEKSEYSAADNASDGSNGEDSAVSPATVIIIVIISVAVASGIIIAVILKKKSDLKAGRGQ